MEILIIDDDEYKINKIIIVLKEFRSTHVNYDVANTISNGFENLLMKKYDIVILDLNMPLRENEFPIKDGGLKIIKELKRNSNLNKPEYIIGLTGYPEFKTSCNNFFELEGWTLLEIDEKTAKWEEAIINKLDYISNKYQQRNSQMKKILFLSASPINEDRLRVDHECKKVEEELQRSTSRDKYLFISKFAIGFEDASRAILQNNPNFVHFAGHGNIDGIALENENGDSELIKQDTLIRLFTLFKDTIECLILNSCDSESIAAELSKIGMFVIGMSSEISDNSAVAFSTGFYQALGENKAIKFAFDLGLVHITAKNGSASVPKLWKDGKEVL